jgi:NADH-quinone oxidoreductase subunit J
VPIPFFYLFSLLAVAGAVALVCFRNPVSSAMAMVTSFVGMAALFIGLNAYFVGIIQVLVYAGAIMVLFLFIIMLLDLKVAERAKYKGSTVVAGLVIPGLFLLQLVLVLQGNPNERDVPLDFKEGAQAFAPAEKVTTEESEIYRRLTDPENPTLPDVHLIGHKLFSDYNFPLQVVGVLLLVATVGVVALSRKSAKKAPPSPDSATDY